MFFSNTIKICGTTDNFIHMRRSVHEQQLNSNTGIQLWRLQQNLPLSCDVQ